MSLIILGLNHKTAPVEIRERLTFGPDVIDEALRSLVSLEGVSEAAILSTCNRTEVYCAACETSAAEVGRWLGRFHGLGAERY